MSDDLDDCEETIGKACFDAFTAHLYKHQVCSPILWDDLSVAEKAAWEHAADKIYEMAI